jgi:hypothetical protein
MCVVDQAGNLLRPPREIPEPERIPNGLSALPGYVSRMVASAYPSTWLSVFTADDQHGFGLARLDDETLILLSASAHGESDLERRSRTLFALRLIAPVQDYLSDSDTVRHLAYSLPKSATAITAICRELLTDCFGVQPNAMLHFVLEHRHSRNQSKWA